MALEKVFSKLSKQHQENIKKANSYAHLADYCSFLSNDHGIASVFQRLYEMRSLKIARKNNMAILVGESSFLSFLPVLAKHVDTVLFLDIDTRVLQHNIFMLECLQQADNVEEFLNAYLDSQNPLLKFPPRVGSFTTTNLHNKNTKRRDGVYLDQALLEGLFKSRIVYLEGHHFLHSEAHFESAKIAAKKLRFHTFEADFYNNKLMANLGEELFKLDVHIALVNVTNLYDFDAPLCLLSNQQKGFWCSSQNLYRSLFLALDRPEETVIMYSLKNTDLECQDLIAQVANSLSEFKRETLEYSSIINIELRGITKTHGLLSKTQYKALFFNMNLVTDCLSVPPIFEKLRGILIKHFPFCIVSCVKVNSSRELIDVVVRLSRNDAEKLLAKLEAHSIPHSNSPLNEIVVVCLREVNLHAQLIVEAIQKVEREDRPRVAFS